jgi:hypothetical protein
MKKQIEKSNIRINTKHEESKEKRNRNKNMKKKPKNYKTTKKQHRIKYKIQGYRESKKKNSCLLDISMYLRSAFVVFEVGGLQQCLHSVSRKDFGHLLMKTGLETLLKVV